MMFPGIHYVGIFLFVCLFPAILLQAFPVCISFSAWILFRVLLVFPCSGNHHFYTVLHCQCIRPQSRRVWKLNSQYHCWYDVTLASRSTYEEKKLVEQNKRIALIQSVNRGHPQDVKKIYEKFNILIPLKAFFLSFP